MEAIELIGDIDDDHRLHAQVPTEVPVGQVRLIILLPGEDVNCAQAPRGKGVELELLPMPAVARLTAALEQMPEIRLAVLFGSAAKGTAGPTSDIDVGVSLKRGAGEPPALRVALERAIGGAVDLIWLDGAPPLLRFEVARDGVVLVERDAHAWADFRARAMIDWWDWAPIARLMHDATIRRLREEALRGPS